MRVYDLAARREVSSFDVAAVNDPSQIVLAGERIIINHGYEVVAYGLDWSHDADRTFRTVAYRLSGMAASPDVATVLIDGSARLHGVAYSGFRPLAPRKQK